MIPTQRANDDDPQPGDVTVTITIGLRIEAQRAELHLDLPDDVLTGLAVHSVALADQSRPS